MKETKAILSAYRQLREKGRKSVLATVVHVEGSSYRAAGARMLIDEYGMMTGAISGGCLEGDALRKAMLALDQNQNKLVTYDTSDEDDAVIGAQLGCNGIIQVLFEPIDPSNDLNPVVLLRKAADYDKPVALVSLFNLDKSREQPGTRLLLDETGKKTGRLDDPLFSDKIEEIAKVSIDRRIPHFGEYRSGKQAIHAFIDIITPPPTLVIVGAGNDAQVLSEMARVPGWNVTVVDGRPTHANRQRFNSCRVVVSNPESVLENIRINETTAFVLMTHNYKYDLAVLKLLLKEEIVPYIGILGPNKKYQRMLDDMASDGIEPTGSQISKIYAPVGLQIGAETPAEIALSILSEIQAVLTRSNVRHLRELEGSIHKKEMYQIKSYSL